MAESISEWVRNAPPAILSALQSVPVKNLLKEQRNRRFQMVGAYDGAMSDECKATFRIDYESLDEFIKALENS